jgi:cell division protein ZapB
MAGSKQTQQDELDLKKLERQVDDLIHTCEALKGENRALRHQQDSLVTERANLIDKVERARSRVEAMIQRLRTLEQGG